MIRRAPVQQIEAFHLVFLRVLETKLDRSCYVVKGGFNLRAWFASERYSEDLDLDVDAIEPHALRSSIDKVLAAPAFQTMLRVQDLQLTRVSSPKQTDTTQRWKFELASEMSEVHLHTKVEFSRRGIAEPFVMEAVRSEAARSLGIPVPSANHYTAAAAMRQKMRALAGRRVMQARDIWDLDHLLRMPGSDPGPLPTALADSLPAAIERVMDMPFEDYKAQVVPFLLPEAQELHGTRKAWDRMRELVVDRLMELGT